MVIACKYVNKCKKPDIETPLDRMAILVSLRDLKVHKRNLQALLTIMVKPGKAT